MLAHLESLAPDLVVIGIQLHTLENLDTIRLMRAHPHLAMSALGLSDDCERCMDAGASDFLSHLAGPGDLLGRVQLLLA